jgi:hypothetical protein
MPPLCTRELSISLGAEPYAMLYCGNYQLGSAHATAEDALIIIHGVGGNAPIEYGIALEALRTSPKGTAGTIVVVPQFLTDAQVNATTLPDRYLRWRHWAWGLSSTPQPGSPTSARLSSFDVVDRIAQALLNKSNVPRLKTIVIFGHSAGGQFVNRYAAATATSVIAKSGEVDVRFVVANPAVYMYLGPERHIAGSNDRFSIPSRRALRGCPGYDDYGFGLRRVPDYLARVGPERIRAQYVSKRITYMIGSNDVSTTDPGIGQSCEPMLQGRHRLERAITHFNHLRYMYGSAILSTQQLVVVKNVGHSMGGMLRSACGYAYVLSDTSRGCSR